MAKAIKKTKPDKNNGFPKNKKFIIPKTIPSPVKVFTTNIGRSRISARYEPPEWDIAECNRILDVESYVRRAFRNKKNLFLKEGYEFVGPESSRVNYIKKRFKQMEETTEVPFPILISQTVWSLTRCSNAFWVKVRKTEASGGKERKTPNNKTLKPVAGYFLLPPETVYIRRDEYGKITGYEQCVHGKEAKQLKTEDVIHFYFDKREGNSFGTPVLTSVKDDIRALRRIEENVELLVQQHLFPLFHYKVGTENHPAGVTADGRTEVEEIQMKITTMPSDGCWVTPERHEIKPLTTTGAPIAVEKVIEHFKQRIFTGLGNSSVDMGEGGTASRSTAQTMSRNLVDDTKADQKEFSVQVQSKVIRELLLESTFSDSTVLDKENAVYLRFKEIDFESRQAKENHYMDLFLKNGITHSELRIELGYQPFEGNGWPTSNSKPQMLSAKGEGDWSGTNYGLIERDKIILQSLDEPGTDASKAETKSRATSNKAKSAGGNSVSNKNQPSNQHGARPSTKVNKDSFEGNGKIPSLDVIFMQRPPMESMLKQLRSDMSTYIATRGLNYKEIQLIINSAFSETRDRLVSFGQRAYRIGLRDSSADIWDVKADVADSRIYNHMNKYITKLEKEFLETIKRNTIKNDNLRSENIIITGVIFDTLNHRSKMIDNSEIMRAYNYGLASGHRVNGFSEMTSMRHNGTSCNICDNNILFYKETDVIIYTELPPLHPNCS